MFIPITKIDMAKAAAKIIVSGSVSSYTATTIAEHTEYDEDSTVVRAGSAVIGWYVADKMSPLTDAIVETAADRLKTWKNRKNQTETSE